MFGYNPFENQELASDMWIEQNIPGGLNSPLGTMLDNAMGGNPNPTFGQMMNSTSFSPMAFNTPRVTTTMTTTSSSYSYGSSFGYIRI